MQLPITTVYLSVLWNYGLCVLEKDTSKASVSASDQEEFLQAHNDYRRGVSPSASNMKKMSWDDSLSRKAQAWADQCEWRHGQPAGITSNYDQVGQNLWLHTGGYGASDSTKDWYDEVSDYTYSSNSCSKVCGHYTQVVWADSHAVGCGIRYCASGLDGSGIVGAAYYIVCNYGPAGNYVGQKPYQTGGSCSACTDDGYDECDDRLCAGDGSNNGGNGGGGENIGNTPTTTIVTVLLSVMSSWL